MFQAVTFFTFVNFQFKFQVAGASHRGEGEVYEEGHPQDAQRPPGLIFSGSSLVCDK